MGAFDDEGFLTLKDRSKDLIISGGSNIYPREVEEVLLRHPGVFEVSVIGRPHAGLGRGSRRLRRGARRSKPYRRTNWIRCVCPRSRASSGRAAMSFSKRCRRTIMARC